ncbi:MAG: response regulator [Planctomycetota bacterium]
MTAMIPAGSKTDASSGNPSRTVLVADDSLTVLRLIDRTLTDAGFEVVLAEDGKQAVKLAIEHKPDLVVLDINMPELDGYGVCHDLLTHRSWNSETPVVFLTCSDAPHLPALGEQLGAFLSKPTEPDLLLETVERLIGRASNP